MAQSESQIYALVLGRVISHLREQRRVSQQDLAARSGFTQPTLSRIERGQATPDAFGFRKLAAALGMTPAELNEHVEAALGQTERIAAQWAPVTRGQSKTPWWQYAVAAAGAAGMAGLVAFAVAAVLDGKKPTLPSGRKPPKH